MESNTIRNYNEITESGILPSIKYIEKILPIQREEDKDFCLRFLTLENNHLDLCHKYYTNEYIKTIIESSDFVLFFHKKDEIKTIVAFALVRMMKKKKGNILNILLVCATPNKNKFGQMIAHSLYNFAIRKKCKYLYTSPRTAALRATFIKYGFEPIFGREGVDEVLEKEIEENNISIIRANKTRKIKSKIDIDKNAYLQNL